MKLYFPNIKNLEKIKTKDITIAIYGLGKMGLPLAVVFADYGFKVIGVGKNPKNVEKINRGINPVTGEENLDQMLKLVINKKNLSATTDGIEASKKSDVKIIIIPTFLTAINRPDLNIVEEVTENIAQGLNKGDIVILESTAPPGTTLNFIASLLEKISGLKLNKDFSVAHCPERTSSGTAIADIMGRLNPKIIGCSDKKTAKILEWLYRKINKKGVVVVSDPTIAEMVKVSEGLYRDLNIAYANNLYLICRELGIDSQEVIKAANTDRACHILSPGPGVGGHCIPVYPYFILNSVKKNKELIKLARSINDNMSNHIISLVEGALRENGKDLKEANILVLGIAYRGGVKETRKSPGIKITKEIIVRSKNVYVYDPMFNQDEIKDMGLEYKDNFKNIDCIIITTEQSEFKSLDWNFISEQMKTKVVIDAKNIINKDNLEKLGFTIRRIGYAI